jgi:hypothetical protein
MVYGWCLIWKDGEKHVFWPGLRHWTSWPACPGQDDWVFQAFSLTFSRGPLRSLARTTALAAIPRIGWKKKCRSKKRVLQIVKIELRWSKFWKIWWDVFVPCLFHVCSMLLLHSPVIGYRLLLLCISCVAAGSEESGISKDQHLQIYRITDFKNYIYIIYIYMYRYSSFMQLFYLDCQPPQKKKCAK